VHVLDKIPSFTSYYMSSDNQKQPADIEKEIQDAAKIRLPIELSLKRC
jgi:hypothetical protein